MVALRAESEWSSYLSEKVRAALEIASTVLKEFGAAGYNDTDDPNNSFGGEKPLAETSMLLYAAAPIVEEAGLRRVFDATVTQLVPSARSEKVLMSAALRPAQSAGRLLPHVLLTQLGFQDSLFAERLQRILGELTTPGHERPPVGTLEQHWIDARLSRPASPASRRAALQLSALATGTPILGGGRDDAYALTHTLFYLADFGNGRPRLPRAKADILADFEGHLAKTLDAQDYDLVGELLMAWPLTNTQWSPAAAFAFQVLASVDRFVGVLPGGTTRADRLSVLTGDERMRYAVATGYHTVYVYGMLAALALRSKRVPRIRPAHAASALATSVRRVLDLGHLPFADDIESMEPGVSGALTPFLTDLALVQRARLHDYGAMEGLLREREVAGLPPSPVSREAQQLLSRLAAFAVGSRIREAAAEGSVAAG